MLSIITSVKNKSSIPDFGKRIIELRKARGLTQTELGNKIGVSKRVIAYYEGETQYPPTHLLIPLAKALKVTTDELLGLKKINIVNPDHAKLWRRLKKTESLSPKDQKTLLHLLDALAAGSKTRK